jgi:hypothetical protein
MSDADDKQFESYMKSFRPVDPEPLPLRTKMHSASARGRSMLAVSAVACLAAVALVFIVLHRGSDGAIEPVDSGLLRDLHAVSRRGEEKRIGLPTVVLTRLALDDSRTFDEFMTDKVNSQFPSMKNEQSALRVLAKE